VRLRVPRLPDSVVAAFAQERLERDVNHDPMVISGAGGCIGRLVAYGNSATGSAAGGRFLEGARRGQVEQLSAALAQPPFEARGAFTELLDGLLQHLRAEARAGGDPQAAAAAIGRVLELRALARGNVNPQLLATVLGEAVTTVSGDRR